jgi:hypothetical protein
MIDHESDHEQQLLFSTPLAGSFPFDVDAKLSVCDGEKGVIPGGEVKEAVGGEVRLMLGVDVKAASSKPI